jgi:protein arginine N-methyltransferase 1
MNPVAAFGRTMADDVRIDAYEAAIRGAVRPGVVVLDIGCGAGLRSLLAARAGARKVYALETSDAIETAQEIAAANRIETIEFVKAQSTEVALAERADVIVSDLRGVLPLLRDHLPVIIDARQRHLAPGGILVPRRDDVYAALADLPEEYERTAGPWQRQGRGFYMQAGRRVVMNTWRRIDVSCDQLLCEPQRWATMDYLTIESINVRNTITLRPVRSGVAHGVVVWFDAMLADGIAYSNAPGEDGAHYGRAFFPFADALEVTASDRVVVELTADRHGADYAWTWTSMLYQGDAAEPTTTLHQSTLLAQPLDRVRKRDASHVPLLNVEGAIDAAILQAMNGDATLSEIATELTTRFADRFRSRADALARVSDLAERYSL